ISTRDLFGAFRYSSTGPERSVPCVLTTMLPVDLREVSFPSASRPPSAARYLSMSASAVCADAERLNSSNAATASTQAEQRLVMAVGTFSNQHPATGRYRGRNFKLQTSNLKLQISNSELRRPDL